MKPELKKELQQAGLRATPARLQVLKFLKDTSKPIGIEELQKAHSSVNKVTLYRMMEDFTSAKLVESVDIGHGHTDYEYSKRGHHHHAICNSCGKVEDVYPCKNVCTFKKVIATESKEFAEITKQSTAFYGTCLQCK